MGSCSGRSIRQMKQQHTFKKTKQQQSQEAVLNRQIMIDVLLLKNGRITKEYTLLNPPIGKGIVELNLYQKGSTGEVRKAIHRKSGMMRAIKILQRTQNTRQENLKFMREVELLEELSHPNIVNILEYYSDDRFLYIVTDLYLGGELFNRIEIQKLFSEKQAAEIMRQIFKALSYLHENQIMHRDLRPENIFFESDQDDYIRIGDFGSALRIDPFVKQSGVVGSAYYMAPEMLKGKYDEKIDIWAAGVIMHILLCGYPPFSGKNQDQIQKKIIKGQLIFLEDEWSQISIEARNFITKCLNPNPEIRISAKNALLEPWILNNTQQLDIGVDLLKRVFKNIQTYNVNFIIMLAEFKIAIMLLEATMKMIVNFLASKEEKLELMSVFQLLDTNNDGKITVDELTAGFAKIMDEEDAGTEASRIIAQFDKRKIGGLNYSISRVIAFLVIGIDRLNLLTKIRMETAFKMIDRNGSGGIAIDELKETFYSNKQNDDVWKMVISEVDKNQDGLISLSEFKEMLLKCTK